MSYNFPIGALCTGGAAVEISDMKVSNMVNCAISFIDHDGEQRGKSYNMIFDHSEFNH